MQQADALHFFAAAEYDGNTLVQPFGADGKGGAAGIGGQAARLFDKQAERIGFVHQPQLACAVGVSGVFGVEEHAAAVREGYTAFADALAQADAVSLHCPLTDETRNMIGEAELKTMKPQAVLVNVGRGGLADEQAVLAALKYGTLGGAGFDVLTTEPPRGGNPLLSGLPNLIVTPHVAWASEEAVAKMTDILEANINLFMAGRPQNVVV